MNTGSDPIKENEEINDEQHEDVDGEETIFEDQGTEIDELSEKEQELSELKDKYLRIHAEFDNFRKRTMREKMEFLKTASQDVIEDLLPILDDFDRAKRIGEDPTTPEQFPEGVNLVYQKLYRSLKSKGLEEMDTDGETFDPEFHEAITKIPASSDDMKGKIIDTIEKGYLLKDKIIRYAKVVVAE